MIRGNGFFFFFLFSEVIQWHGWTTYVARSTKMVQLRRRCVPREGLPLSSSWIISLYVKRVIQVAPLQRRRFPRQLWPISVETLHETPKQTRSVSVGVLSTQMAHLRNRSLDADARSPGGIVVWANLKPVHITTSIHISRAQWYFVTFVLRLGVSSPSCLELLRRSSARSCCPYTAILPTARWGLWRTGTKRDSTLEGCGAVRPAGKPYELAVKCPCHVYCRHL